MLCLLSELPFLEECGEGVYIEHLVGAVLIHGHLSIAIQEFLIQSGYVIKVGPGYPLPAQNEEREVWESKEEEVRYLPLQAQEGDLAVYLQNAAYEISFNDEKYLIVPHAAILMLVRDEGLFE